MPNHEFENYLALVSRLMRLNRSQTESIRQELSDHLETRVSELVESGVDVVAATRRALEEFGDAAVLAKEFQGIFQLTRRRWMMRFATFSIAATFLAAVLIMAMWPSAARFGAPSSSLAQDVPDAKESAEGNLADNLAVGSVNTTVTSARPKRKTGRTIFSSEDVDRKLQQPADFDFVETPLVEVMDMIRNEHGFNVLLDETARADLDEETSINFSIKNVRLATALRLLLSKHNATYLVQDGILRLISLDVAGDPQFHRRKLFDCRHLLATIAQQEPVASEPTVVSDSGTESEASQNSVSPQQPIAAKQEPVRRLAAEIVLREVIKTTVDPDSWDSTNGDGTLMFVGGFLVATQTQESLENIGDLIGELNQALSSR